MAMLDFLGKGISSNVPINQNTMVNNTAGDAIGPTYGELLAASARSSGNPALSGLRPLTPVAPTQGATIQPLQPTQTMQTPLEKNAQNQGDSFSQIISMLMQMFTV